MGMRVRPMLKQDRCAIRAMLQACGVFSEEEVRVALDLLDAEAPGADDSGYIIFVAEDGDCPCGYVCFGHTPLTFGTWHLYWMCVHPSAHGSGAAQALQARVEAFVRSRGGERIVLETSSRTDYARARRFYERAGYQAVGNIRGFYRPFDDCITYCKRLVDSSEDATVVKPSPGRGRGVFASGFLAAGELIDESPVVVVPASELEHLDRTVLENYYFVWGRDGALLLGKMSFCNHTYTPNAVFHCDMARQTIRFVALRDIQVGNEITINYNGDPEDLSPLGDHYRIIAVRGEWC
jgi:GNAT superfamily N-acetyltransferase